MDEHVAKAVVKGLRSRGVDAKTVAEMNMLSATDEEHLLKAREEWRVIFTQDNDFLRLHASGQKHAGIVYTRQGAAVGQIIKGLMLIYQLLDAEDMKNHVEYL